ncbi:hypothetical protein HanIR_Chr16g0797401 [Helianthus annuus]|nr:hypothetical protein HanIR_Chr16g0797401 [Helianthus annuus]
MFVPEVWPILRLSSKEKTNLWTKVAKLATPQGRKWHFTLYLNYDFSSYVTFNKVI